MDDRQGNLRPIDVGLGESLENSRRTLEEMDRISMSRFRTSLASGIPSVFVVGEELDIKNSKFKIITIGKRYMKLKLLPHGK